MVGILAAVLSGFVAAAAAPLVYRLCRGLTGYVLALLPIGLVVYFGSFLGPVAAGATIDAGCPWFPELGIDLTFHVDGLGLLFALLVSGVGALILIYGGGYLKGHPFLGRFYLYVLSFMASMLGVVLSDNLVTLFIFWELTSLTSYFLIGFENERREARDAAWQALLVTGLGGLALLAGCILMGQAGGSMEVTELASRGGDLRRHALYLPILFCILGGAFTKSAQVPFHFWLPNAMEAPTPVSAYLHSVTMVKAGVYLLARLAPVLGGTGQWLGLVGGFGAATMITGAWIAYTQTDLKRILAYSTVSVLGLLTMLIGLGTELAVQAAVVYLLAHSLYKGALFMAAGTVHHETGERDITRLGGLVRVMPVTAAATALAAFSMAGLPPLFGFIAKEALYEATTHAAPAVAITVASVVASALLVSVSLTLAFKPFLGRLLPVPKHPHEAPPSLWLGPVLLSGLGLAAGIAPQVAGAWILVPAAAAVLGHETHVHLALWHGLNPLLALSGATFAAGIALYGLSTRLRGVVARYRGIARAGPARAYDLAVGGLRRTAEVGTGVLQNGYLRYYLMVVFLTAACLVSFKLFFGRVNLPLEGVRDVRFHEAGLAILVLLGALRAITTRSRVEAIVSLGVVGAGVGLIYLMFGAPDLAMTQVMIETLTVVLFALIFYRLPRFEIMSSRGNRIRDAVIAIAFGGLMTTLVLLAHGAQVSPEISSYFTENSYALAHGRNVVNVILVDFRGLDTLGEITVLSTAALGIFSLLKLHARRGSAP
jgi:multicomponent Na+:H+ antiporter subunit A